MESKCTNIRCMFIFACSFVRTIFAIAEALQWLQYCDDAFTNIYIVSGQSPEVCKLSSTEAVSQHYYNRSA